MTDIMTRRLVPCDDAIASPVGDETVILHLKNGTYFGLDPVGTRVWALLQDGLAPGAICARLSDEYEVEAAVLEADVRRLLGELEANQIVAERGDG